MISDTYALISSRLSTQLTTTSLLSLLLSLSISTEKHHYLIWRQIFAVLAKLQRAFLFSSPKLHNELQNLHKHLVLSNSPPDISEIGSDDLIAVQNEKATWYAQAARHPHLQPHDSELFDAFPSSNAKALDPNLRKLVFQVVVNERVRSIQSDLTQLHLLQSANYFQRVEVKANHIFVCVSTAVRHHPRPRALNTRSRPSHRRSRRLLSTTMHLDERRKFVGGVEVGLICSG